MNGQARTVFLSASLALVVGCGAADPGSSTGGEGGAGGGMSGGTGGAAGGSTAGRGGSGPGAGGSTGQGGSPGGGGGGMPAGGAGGGAAGAAGGAGGARTDAGPAGMGGAAGGSPNCPATIMGCAAGPYMPVAIGNMWTYRVTEGPMATPFTKTQTIVRMEAIGGMGPNATKMALRFETRKTSGLMNATPDLTVSWQALEGARVVRYRETSFRAGTMNVDVEDHWVPPRLRFDSMPTGKALARGLAWAEMYTEFKREPLRMPPATSECMNTENWSVHDVDLKITVLGKMYNVVKVEKKGGMIRCKDGFVLSQNILLDKFYYFARGIGKVKEEPVNPSFGGQLEELMTATIK